MSNKYKNSEEFMGLEDLNNSEKKDSDSTDRLKATSISSISKYIDK